MMAQSVLYVDLPMTQSYTFKAKVQYVSATDAGGSGIVFGEFTNPALPDFLLGEESGQAAAADNPGWKGLAGMRLLWGGSGVPYAWMHQQFVNPLAANTLSNLWGAGSTAADVNGQAANHNIIAGGTSMTDKEVTFEMKWNSNVDPNVYTFILSTGAGDGESHTWVLPIRSGTGVGVVRELPDEFVTLREDKIRPGLMFTTKSGNNTGSGVANFVIKEMELSFP